jgi:hypothetical protein
MEVEMVDGDVGAVALGQLLQPDHPRRR